MDQSREREIVSKLWKLYVNNSSRYLMCQSGHIWMPMKKTAEGKRVPVNLNRMILYGHLHGAFNVGVYAAQRSAMFICFDVDLHDDDLVRQLIDVLVAVGFNKEDIHPSFSGGKGYHVEIFFDKPMANISTKKLYEYVIHTGGFDRKKVEFRPTTNQAIRMPLSRHYKTDNVCWYLDVNTLEPIEDMEYILRIQQVSRDGASALINKLPSIKPPKQKLARRDIQLDADIRMDGAPMVTGPGQRHNMMKDVATFRRSLGGNRDQIYRALMAWVAMQDRDAMSSSDDEIEDDALNLAAWAEQHVPVAVEKAGRPFGRDVFDAEDLNYILNGTTATQRRLLFRSVLSRKIWKKDHTRQRLIALNLGLTPVTISKALTKLAERGLLQTYHGRRAKTDYGHFVNTSNTYYKGENVEQVLDPDDLAASYWRMSEALHWKHFLWYYADMMTTMLGTNLVKYVKKSEADDIIQILQEGVSSDGDDEDYGDGCGRDPDVSGV